MSFRDLCTYCQEDFYSCQCEYFHPNIIKVLNNIRLNEFVLKTQEVEDLLDYFYKRAGYISAEFDLPVLAIIKKMEKHLKEISHDKENV